MVSVRDVVEKGFAPNAAILENQWLTEKLFPRKKNAILDLPWAKPSIRCQPMNPKNHTKTNPRSSRSVKTKFLSMIMAVPLALATTFAADEKIALDESKDNKVQLDEPKLAGFEKELRSLPDGVLKVKTNADGSFKSLVVKATVEIEDVLGGQKGKRLGRKEGEIQCKRHLSQWLNEYCTFAEASDKTTTIITKGDSAKDAVGNTVRLRKQEGKEVKVLTEAHASFSSAALKGLIVLHSEVTSKSPPEYVLVMGLSQTTISQAALVKGALDGKAHSNQPPGVKPSGKSTDDKPTPERKTNPEAEDFIK